VCVCVCVCVCEYVFVSMCLLVRERVAKHVYVLHTCHSCLILKR
jgi:hypothetical protein